MLAIKQAFLIFAAAAVALVSPGCGQSDRVAVYPVHGRLTFEGKPMAGGGSIALIATGGQQGKTAGAEIKPDGAFTLTTYEEGDGSMPGEFRVVVTQVVVKEPDASEDGQAVASGPISVVAEDERIPAIYSDRQNSPLTARIEANSDNELNLELKRL
ncbi:MAG TPA: hypothetical protein VHC19_30250 [Pirellulales bacterium]|jgi:hypothetical protein|nr:hypothetical protein [Pirellulales bacterium]